MIIPSREIIINRMNELKDPFCFHSSNLSESASRPAKRSKISSSNDDDVDDEQNSSQIELNE